MERIPVTHHVDTSTVLDLPDTEVAAAARKLAFEVSPAFVYNHSVRSYLFARELAAANGMRADVDYDDELVFLSCVLHDLGATDFANGDQRFEVDGADAAAVFLAKQGMDEARVKAVWDAIVLHTSVGLAHRFGSVAAVAQMGIGADIIGLGKEALPTGFADRVHAELPRHDLGYALSEAVARQVDANPVKGGPLTFPGQVHRLCYPRQRAITWFDAIDASGWNDRPVADSVAGGATEPDGLAKLFVERFGAGDVEGVVALYEQDAVFGTGSGSPHTGVDEVRAALGALIGAGASIDLRARRLHVVDDVAVISNEATVCPVRGADPMTTMTTEVARRQRNGLWQYVIDDPFFAL